MERGSVNEYCGRFPRRGPTPQRICLLGSGTSTGVPEVGCYCDTCISEDPRDHRLRTSLLVVSPAGRNILIDCSADFRQQALSVGLDHLDAIILTHQHYDHVGGLDDLRTIAWDQEIPIYAEPSVLDSIRARLYYYFGENRYPGTPHLTLHSIDDLTPFALYDLVLEPIRVMHGKQPILGFRLGDFAFLTDLKTIAPEDLEQLRGVDTLFVNGLRYTKPHPTHQTIEEALALIDSLSPRQSYLIHLAHHAPPYRRLSAQLPPGVFVSYDGLTLERTSGQESHLSLSSSHGSALAPPTSVHPFRYIDCGQVDYLTALTEQRRYSRERIEAKEQQVSKPEDLLLLCEHEPVLTLGKHGKSENLLISPSLLEAHGVNLVAVERGGDITYHGPGQITGYPIFDLERYGIGVREYIYMLEQCVIDLLRLYGIEGERLEGATGVWIAPATRSARKICAIGVHVSRYITLHGFALNVNTDLSYFRLINPCGFTDKGVTSMAQELGGPVYYELVKEQLVGLFRRHFYQLWARHEAHLPALRAWI